MRTHQVEQGVGGLHKGVSRGLAQAHTIQELELFLGLHRGDLCFDRSCRLSRIAWSSRTSSSENKETSRAGAAASVSIGVSKTRTTCTRTSALRMFCRTSGGKAPREGGDCPPTSTKVISAHVVFLRLNIAFNRSMRASGTLIFASSTIGGELAAPADCARTAESDYALCMWFWTATVALAGEECRQVTLKEVLEIEAPAVLVLGERYGHQPDLSRAESILRGLDGPVQLGIELVSEQFQPVLDRHAAGNLDAKMLPEALEWAATGYPWGPYQRLVTAGTELRAAGPRWGAPPSRVEVPVPTGYGDLLRPWTEEQQIPLEHEREVLRTMAWRDLRIAELSSQGWSRSGYLVILAERAHVEGGLGVAWQMEQRTDVPVHRIILSWAGSPCYAGDWVFKPALFERAGG